MAMITFTYAGQTMWDKICQHGKQAVPTIALATRNNFGPSADLSKITCEAGSWLNDAYALIFHMLHDGFWMRELTRVTNTNQSLAAFIENLDYHYFKCNSESLRTAKNALYTFNWNPSQGLEERLRTLDDHIASFEFENTEVTGTIKKITTDES